MPITFTGPTGGAWSIGSILAFIVLVLCVVLWFIGKPLTEPEILLLIGVLALARLT